MAFDRLLLLLIGPSDGAVATGLAADVGEAQMAIEEPTIKVICDGCGNQEIVMVAYSYHSYSERTGFFDIETTLHNMREVGWCIRPAPDELARIDSCPDCAGPSH